MKPIAPSSAEIVTGSFGSSGKGSASLGGQSSGQSSRASSPAIRPAPRPFDPWETAHEFPDRWRAYLHAHFRNHMVVSKMFNVSERAARKWWDGDGACRGDKVAMAIAMHPADAAEMLFGIAAE